VYTQPGNDGNFLECLQEPLVSASIPPTALTFVVLPRDLEIEYADVEGQMPDQKQIFILTSSDGTWSLWDLDLKLNFRPAGVLVQISE
jgi:hypothetical protein